MGTWDNHGRFLYAAVGKQIYSLRLDSDVQSDVICNGREVIPEGTLIDLQMRVNEKLVGVVQKDGELTVFAVDLTYTTNAGIVFEVEQYTMSAAPFFALPAIVDSDALSSLWSLRLPLMRPPVWLLFLLLPLVL